MNRLPLMAEMPLQTIIVGLQMIIVTLQITACGPANNYPTSANHHHGFANDHHTSSDHCHGSENLHPDSVEDRLWTCK